MKRFTLSADERIKRKKDFDRIYKFGLVIFSSQKKIKATYIIEDTEKQPSVKTAVAVSKKAGKAVWRNRVKRLIRESYRLNKENLVNKAFASRRRVLLIFSANTLNEVQNKKIRYSDISPAVEEIINKLIIKVEKMT